LISFALFCMSYISNILIEKVVYIIFISINSYFFLHIIWYIVTSIPEVSWKTGTDPGDHAMRGLCESWKAIFYWRLLISEHAPGLGLANDLGHILNFPFSVASGQVPIPASSDDPLHFVFQVQMDICLGFFNNFFLHDFSIFRKL